MKSKQLGGVANEEATEIIHLGLRADANMQMEVWNIHLHGRQDNVAVEYINI